MRQFDGIAAAADDIRRHILMNSATLPAAMVERLDTYTRTGSSPVDLAVQFTESVYANKGRKGVTKETRDIAAGAALVIDQLGFHNRLDERASAIAKVLARENGEPGNWPKADTDPAPAQGFDLDKPALSIVPGEPAQ